MIYQANKTNVHTEQNRQSAQWAVCTKTHTVGVQGSHKTHATAQRRNMSSIRLQAIHTENTHREHPLCCLICGLYFCVSHCAPSDGYVGQTKIWQVLQGGMMSCAGTPCGMYASTYLINLKCMPNLSRQAANPRLKPVEVGPTLMSHAHPCDRE